MVHLSDSESRNRWVVVLTVMSILLGLSSGILSTVLMNGLLGWAKARHAPHLHHAAGGPDPPDTPQPKAR